jgi:hypothetical protein
MKWWFAKWKCFNCGQWNGCCGDETSDPGGLWCEPDADRSRDGWDAAADAPAEAGRHRDGSRRTAGEHAEEEADAPKQ